MVSAYCLNCGSENVKLDDSEKYLVCNSCNDREYIRDLEIGLTEFNSKAFYEMCKIKEEIEGKIEIMKDNKPMENVYKNQLKIVNRCINSLYL